MSIIVPARNEAAVIANLLESLAELSYPTYEVIVVDDRSTDATAEIAQRYLPRLAGKLIRGTPPPAGWGGKNWACQQAAAVAAYDLLLFTDADTLHAKDSLKRAVAALSQGSAGLMSALPFHEGTTWWEALLGPFHVLLLTVTAPYARAKPGRLYAIGQYLLFTRAAYLELGGHASVKAELAEDLAFANNCVSAGVPYLVAPVRAPLFRVRMYPTLRAFVAGWRRNVRMGLRAATPLAAAEVTLLIVAMAGIYGGAPAAAALGAALLVLVAVVQRRLGNFHWLGVVLFPFGVALFTVTTALAASDAMLSRPVRWKGRAYAAPPG